MQNLFGLFRETRWNLLLVACCFLLVAWYPSFVTVYSLLFGRYNLSVTLLTFFYFLACCLLLFWFNNFVVSVFRFFVRFTMFCLIRWMCFEAGNFMFKKLTPAKIWKFLGGRFQYREFPNNTIPMIWTSKTNAYISIPSASFW